MYLYQEKNLRASGHYTLTSIPFDTFFFKSTPQDSLLHPMKQFIKSSAFFHLSNNLLSDYTKLQNNITGTIFGNHLLIGLSLWVSFVNLLFSTKQCRNCAFIFKVPNFALIVVFFPVTIKRTHVNANMPQSALCGCYCTGSTSKFDLFLAQLTIEYIYCFAWPVPSD